VTRCPEHLSCNPSFNTSSWSIRRVPPSFEYGKADPQEFADVPSATLNIRNFTGANVAPFSK
jgi:hypothetical protein